MINIKSVTIRNFLSVGNNTQAINLSGSALTLVLGNNNDSGGRNGTGKTTMIQAISYGLFGKPLTRVRLPNLCNNINKKNMVVTLDFECGGVAYRVERGQKPAFMRFFVNNNEQKEDDEAQGENRKTQARIDSIIGMSHSLFRHIVALNTFTEPFLRMSVGDQRAVAEELLGVTQISDRAETLKSFIVKTKDRIREQEAIIRTTIEANDRIAKTIIITQRQAEVWETAKADTIRDLEAQMATLESINFEDEIAMFEKLDAFTDKDRDLTHALDLAQREFIRATNDHAEAARRIDRLLKDKPTSHRSLVLGADLERKNKALSHYVTVKLPKLEKSLEAVRSEQSVADSSDCVCCGQPLSGTDHLATVIANINTRVRSAENELARETREYEAVAADVRDLRTAIAEAQEAEERDRAHKETEAAMYTADAAERASHVISRQVALEESKKAKLALGERPQTAFATRDELYSAKQICETLSKEHKSEIGKVSPYDEQIAALQTAMMDVCYDNINELANLLKHQDFVLKLLMSKDSFIRKRIVDQNISFMNGRLDGYLVKLGLPHTVQFQSDLSVEITLLGIDMDFEQLSRGEMNRVILATSWAFRDVWESLNEEINLLLVDELIDSGLDQFGAETAVTVLKEFSRKNKNVFLISHREELVASFENIMTVNKKDGFTTFENS